MDVLLISGFLGAGKTSFIKAMTHATGRQFVVVENEFGELNIDGTILKNDAAAPAEPAKSDEMKIWELTEGCICCSMNMDFSLSVLTIENTLRPDYLLVEPSGVAMPGRIVDGLRRINYEHIGILSPVTIVDSAHFRDSRRDYPEYFNNQIASAGTVVLSKSEGMSPEEFARTEQELSLAPGTTFRREHYSKWPREAWFELLTRRLEGTKPTGKKAPPFRPERPLEHAAFIDVSVSSPAELLVRLEYLISGAFGRIARAKGFMPTAFGEWVRFDVVDGIYEITSLPVPEETGKIVVIGTELYREALHELFGGAEAESGEGDGHH